MTDELMSFLKERVGNSLRAIVEYREADIEVQYHRHDLDESTVRHRTSAGYGQIVQISGSWDDGLTDERGAKRATLQVREEAVIVHLHETRYEGHLISLEPEAARDLTAFLGECLKYVE